MNDINLNLSASIPEGIGNIVEYGFKNSLQAKDAIKTAKLTVKNKDLLLKACLAEMENDYARKKFEKILDQKYANLPEERLATPSNQTFNLAWRGAACCYNNEMLREMFANLIVACTDVEKQEFVHPAFINILEQLSPEDALLIKLIYEEKIKYAGRFYIYQEFLPPENVEHYAYTPSQYISAIFCLHIEGDNINDYTGSFDILNRFNLLKDNGILKTLPINKAEGEQVINDNLVKEWLLNSPRPHMKIDTKDCNKLTILKNPGDVMLNPFGLSLATICIG